MFKIKFALAFILVAGVAGAAWAQTVTCTRSCIGNSDIQTCTYVCS